LLDAGITSFKIEGRLKEAPYVANTVGFYRQKLDTLAQKKHLKKSASGTAALHFTPDPQKTFNRGFTEYGLIEKDDPMGSADTPKSIGRARRLCPQQLDRQSFVLDGGRPAPQRRRAVLFWMCRTETSAAPSSTRSRAAASLCNPSDGIRPGTTILPQLRPPIPQIARMPTRPTRTIGMRMCFDRQLPTVSS
jgi:hypothetical protein